MSFPYDLICFDNNGTFSVAGRPLGAMAPRLMKLRAQYGTRLMMITNNSATDNSVHTKLLEDAGFGPSIVECISSIAVAADAFKTRGFERGYILGNAACRAEFQRLGIKHDSEKPRFVLTTSDLTIDEGKIRLACLFVKKGIPLFQTNSDPVCPGTDSDMPDCGLMTNLISAPTGISPVESFGKEGAAFAVYLKARTRNGERAVIIGDRLRTDIVLAQHLGCDSVWINRYGTRPGESDPKPSLMYNSFSDYLARFGY